jgi:hypothetical protein
MSAKPTKSNTSNTSGTSGKPPKSTRAEAPRRRREPPAHRAGRDARIAEKARSSPPRVEPVMPDAPGSRRVMLASWIGTGLLTITAVPATLDPDRFAVAAVVVALGLFAAGTVAFAWAYVVAIGRSRTDLIGMGGLFFLAGSAPRPVQRHLIASFVAQIVVGVATASVWFVAADHFAKATVNPLAFGLMAPMYGLGLMGLWAARFGTFPPRPADPERPARRRPKTADPDP